MNHLDPNLRKLIAWSHRATPPPPPVAPPGFAVDVVARIGEPTRTPSIPDGVLAFVTWTATAIAIGAVAFLLSQPARPDLAPYMNSAAQFLASNITP